MMVAEFLFQISETLQQLQPLRSRRLLLWPLLTSTYSSVTVVVVVELVCPGTTTTVVVVPP